MKEFLKNDCYISGDTLEGFHALCEDLAAHTEKNKVDLRGCTVMHFHRYNERTGTLHFFSLNSSSKSEIIRFDREHEMYTVPLTGKIELSKFRDVKPLLDEMIQNEDYRTVFVINNPQKKGKRYQKEYLFVGESAKKTFGQRMPVNEFNSSLARDIYLAYKLNENADLLDPELKTISDGSRSKDLGVCYIRERMIPISQDEVVSKAVAFYSKDEGNGKIESFATFSQMIKDVTKMHEGASFCKWSFDNHYMKLTLAFVDEETLTTKKGITAAHTFYMSDTAHTRARVVPSWIIDGNVCEIKDDEVPLIAKDGITDFETALEISYEKHRAETAYLAEKASEEVIYEKSSKLLEDIVKRTGMASSQTGIVKKQIDKFKEAMKEKLQDNDGLTYSEFGVLAAKTLLNSDAETKTTEKRIYEVFSGRLMFLDKDTEKRAS